MTDPGVPDPAATDESLPQRPRSARQGMGRGAVIISVVVALGVGVIVGGLIGWQVEKNRVKDDVTKVKAAARAQGAQNVRPLGVVTAVSGDSVTIKLRSSVGSKTFKITGDTTVDRSTTGQQRNLVKGSVVLVQPNYKAGQPTAAEIVVLPASTALGTG